MGRHSSDPMADLLSKGEQKTNKVFVIVAIVVAFLLQTILASNMAIGNVSPNFLLIAALAIALATPIRQSTVIGFCLGLLFDCLGSSGMGCMALVMALSCYLVAFFAKTIKVENFLYWLGALVIVSLFANLLYLILLSAVGFESSFFASIVYRVLPWTLYDTIVGAIFWPLVRKAIVPPKTSMMSSRIQL